MIQGKPCIFCGKAVLNPEKSGLCVGCKGFSVPLEVVTHMAEEISPGWGTFTTLAAAANTRTRRAMIVVQKIGGVIDIENASELSDFISRIFGKEIFDCEMVMLDDSGAVEYSVRLDEAQVKGGEIVSSKGKKL